MLRWPSWRFFYDIESLSARIALQCRPVILQRVLPVAATMSLAEASGYIRARAGGIVASHAALVLSELGAPEQLNSRLVALAKRRIVAGVLSDLMTHRATRTQRRAAA